MININKKTLIIVSLALIIIVGSMFFLNKDSSSQKKSLIIDQGLTPIELTQEELRAIQGEGLKIFYGEDIVARDLQSVRISDELDAIDADINETNLSELDAELEAIESDLLGL